MLSKVCNFIAFQLAWFACILGAGNGIPWLGVIAVLVSVLVHLALTQRRNLFSFLLASALLIGFLFDGSMMLIGVLSFPDHATLITPVPFWMLMMWVNLATTIPISLNWLKKRYALAAVFGFVGGPGAYYTGMKLEAVQLASEVVRSLLLIGLEWSIAMPLLMLVAEKFESVTHKGHTELPSQEGVVS